MSTLGVPRRGSRGYVRTEAEIKARTKTGTETLTRTKTKTETGAEARAATTAASTPINYSSNIFVYSRRVSKESWGPRWFFFITDSASITI